MNPTHRIALSALALVAGLISGTPVDARTDCASNSNVWSVRRHLDGAIDQLQHDRRDYGGHRVAAIGDLQNARNELSAAEAYARTVDRENPRCVHARGPAGGSDLHWGLRAQGGSNRDLWAVGTWTKRMIDQLARDQHDYDGHRVRAIAEMQAARGQLIAAEAVARSRR